MKKITAFILAALMLVGLAACTTTPPVGTSTAEPAATSTAGGEKGKIGALLPSLSWDFQAQMATGIRRAAEEFGYGYQEVDYNSDAELQLSGAETLLSSGVKAYYGIFFNTESANEIFAQHPEVATISQAPNVNANAFIREDYAGIANQFIECLDRYRTENNLEGGDMAAMWLTGSEVEDSQDYLTKMILRDIMTEYCEANGLNFVSDQYPKDDEEAANVTEQLMNAYPDLRYIFCFGSGLAISASNEIASAVSNVDEYFVFASEGNPESFRLIASEDSPYRGLAYNDIEESGYQTGLQLINWIENNTIEDVIINRTLVDESNVSEYLS